MFYFDSKIRLVKPFSLVSLVILVSLVALANLVSQVIARGIEYMTFVKRNIAS